MKKSELKQLIKEVLIKENIKDKFKIYADKFDKEFSELKELTKKHGYNV